MRTFDEILTSVGYSALTPEKVYIHYAYKNGEARPFGNKLAAKQFSHNVESVCTNEEEIATHKKLMRERYEKAELIFHGEMRQYFNDINYQTYQVCLNEAAKILEENSNANLFDEMYDVVALAKKVIAANK